MTVAAKSKEQPGLVVPGLRLKNGAIAGRYRVEKLLGTGSTGFALAAHHIYMRRGVVLKMLTSAPRPVQQRALATAHVVATLRSEHVARMIDTGFTEEGIPFIATEALEGRTLADELAARGTLSATEAVHWILQACEGLAEAHAAGVVHGSLKPKNLFLSGPVADGTGDDATFARTLKVLDFGMPVPFGGDDDDAMPGRATWFASPAYLAPEQLRDPNPEKLDPRVDVWALGVILHQLIAGAFPFAADTVAGMLVAVAYDEPSLLARADVPYELARVIHQCLAKHPGQRIADVATLARMLAPFGSNPTKSTPPLPTKSERASEKVLAAPVVEKAVSLAPPSMTMTIDREEAMPKPSRNSPTVPSLARLSESAKNAKISAPIFQWARRIEEKLKDEHAEDLAPDAVAFHRRRRGAIAMVMVAAALAVVGLVAPPAVEAVSSKTTTNANAAKEKESLPLSLATAKKIALREDDEEMLPIDRSNMMFEPRPFVPPSFMLVEAFISDDASTRTNGQNPQDPPPSARSLDVVTTPPPRIKAKPRLFVRDDPYLHGSKNVWTHPKHLSARPPMPRR